MIASNRQAKRNSFSQHTSWILNKLKFVHGILTCDSLAPPWTFLILFIAFIFNLRLSREKAARIDQHYCL